MPDFYYIDLYFDPDDKAFPDVVDSCVSAMIQSGCRFRELVMSNNPLTRRQVSMGSHVRLGPADIKGIAEASAAEMDADKHRVISFPPLGRIMFEYDFRFDEDVLDDLAEEEDETRTSARDIGLGFIYSENKAYGRKIKATFNMWEEFVLSHGSAAAGIQNMSSVLRMIEAVCRTAEPYFGAMNNEIRLDTEGSLDLLKAGRLPEGNEYAIVGRKMMGLLDAEGLKRSGLAYKDFAGGVLIRFLNRWG